MADEGRADDEAKRCLQTRFWLELPQEMASSDWSGGPLSFQAEGGGAQAAWPTT